MKKQLSLFFAFISSMGFISLPHVSYANIDNAASVNYSYSCEKGKGVLTVSMLYNNSQTVTTKTYSINRAGYITSLEQDDPNQWYWMLGLDKERNAYIPGCGCPDASSETTNYPALFTLNGTGGEVGSDYMFTIGSGAGKEGIRLANTIVFRPSGNGVPSSCSGSTNTGTTSTGTVCENSCKYALLTRSFSTRNTTLNVPISMKTSGSGCALSTPTISCANGNGATISGSASSGYTASIPSSIASQVGTCTLSYTSSCSSSTQTDTISLVGSGTNTSSSGTSCAGSGITVANVSGYPQVRSGSTGNMTLSNLNSGNPSTVTVSCTAGYGNSTTIPTYDHVMVIRCSNGGVNSSGGISVTYSQTGILANRVRTETTTCTYPNPGTYTVYCGFMAVIGFSPYVPPFIDQKKITIGSTCSSGTTSAGTISTNTGTTGGSCTATNCRYTLPDSSFNTKNSDITAELWKTTQTNCTLSAPTISCTKGAGATVRYVGTATSPSGAGYTITIPASIASQVGTCTLSYTACGSTPLTETISIGGAGGSSSTSTSSTSTSSTITTSAPVVTFTVSGTTLTGTVKNLTGTNASSCLEVVGRTGGTNTDTYCRDGVASHWTIMPANNWTYNSSTKTWTLNRTVGAGTDLPSGKYRGYWKNTTNGLIGSGVFSISDPLVSTIKTTPVVTFTVVGSALNGTVTNLSATNASACLEAVGTSTDAYCQDGTASHWTKMPAGGWTYNATSGKWTLTRAVGYNTDMPPGDYRGYWRNDTTGLIGKTTFTISAFSSSSSNLAPGVSFSVSGNILYGKVTNLNINNAAACLENLSRTSGVNSVGYCNSEDSHWTKMTSSNASWKYDVTTGTWNVVMLVGSTSDIPTGRYTGYWKNTDSGLIGSASFTVDDTAGVIVIGSLGGTRQSMFNAGSIDTSAYTSLLSQIRTNAANLVKGMQNGEVANDVLYYKSDVRLPYSTVIGKDFKTLVVYGDLYINENIGVYKGIIVLKNGTSGGNIYVGDSVTYIKGAVFAEGMIRGMSSSASTPNPSEQLLLEGALYSQNTIGGSINPNDLYVYPHTSTADKNAAFVNDLYNMRSKGFSNNYFTGYRNPFIIMYNTTLLYTPPPGF